MHPRIILTAIFLFFTTFNVAALQGGSLASPAQRQGIVGISIGGAITNCIGVLLEADRVLTSASCVQDFNGTGLNPQRVIPANLFRVHPLQGIEIGRSPSLFPVLSDEDLPFVGVNQVNLHPQNTFLLGNFNLAILRLSSALGEPFVTLFNGDRNLEGRSGEVFGWDAGPAFTSGASQGFYRSNILALPPIIEGVMSRLSNDESCIDGTPDTDTVFCAGFRDQNRFLELIDYGAPLYINVDGEQIVAGLLAFSAAGTELNGVVNIEEFANISSMQDFIVDNAPNAQFVFERQPVILAPILQLLIDEE